MDGRGGELNEVILSGCGAEPRVGDVIEFGLSALDGELPLLLKAVVRERTANGLAPQFLGAAPVEKHDLNLFQKLARAAAGYTDA